MTWTKLDDDFNDRGDLIGVSRSARLLYVEMYVFANRLLLDGRIPRAQLRRFTDAEDPTRELAELIAAGVVEEVGDVLLVDWSDQEQSEDVKARRARRKEVQKAYRTRKAKHERGDHDDCDPRYCKKAVTGNATGHKTGHKTPPRPVPSRPVRDRGQGPGSAVDVPSTAEPVCEDHPTQSATNCSSCWADVHAGDRSSDQIGRRLTAVAS